jgi:hypothetical protein
MPSWYQGLVAFLLRSAAGNYADLPAVSGLRTAVISRKMPSSDGRVFQIMFTSVSS